MEENKEEKVEVNKKTRTTKKKQENSRVSDILQKIEVEEEKKETTKKVKNTTENKTTKNEDKEENKTTNKTSKSNSKNKVETKKKSENKKVDKKEEKKEKDKEKEAKPKKDKEVRTNKVNKKVEKQENKELKKIEEEIKKQKKLPKEIAEKVNKKIYGNILIAIIMVIYLIFINLGYTNINQIAFITDLQVFSIALMVTTIIIFEKAYKKDSGKLTINGIEVLSLAILTMFLPRIYNRHKYLFVEIVGVASIVYVVYYFVKCIIIYAKTRKKIRKSDAKKISKK